MNSSPRKSDSDSKLSVTRQVALDEKMQGIISDVGVNEVLFSIARVFNKFITSHAYNADAYRLRSEFSRNLGKFFNI